MSYPVWTICIGKNFIYDPEYNGMECVIVEPAVLRECKHPDRGTWMAPCYIVEWANGLKWQVEPHHLKRKDWHDEDKRAEDRQKVSKLIAACKKAAESAIEAGEKVNQKD